MVSTEPVYDEPVPVARHWHRPAHYSEPYTENGQRLVVPYCECGEPLTPRPASHVKRTA